MGIMSYTIYSMRYIGALDQKGRYGGGEKKTKIHL